MLAVSKALSRAVHLDAVGLHGLGAPGPGGQNAWTTAAVGSAKNARMKLPTAPPAIAAPKATPALSSMVLWLIRGLSG
jgi:hypothetical protein